MEDLQLPVNIDIEEDNESLAMLKRIIRCCWKRKYCRTKMKKAAYFTGLRQETLKKFVDSTFIVELKKVDRSVIYEQLSNFFVIKKIMPTSRQLWDELKEQLPEYMDIESFRLLLADMGFIRKKIKGYGTVVMEKPSITYERFHYLKKKMEYRDEETITCYVDVMTFDSEANLTSVTKIPTGTDGLKLYIFFAFSKHRVYACFSTDVFNQDVFNKWVKEQLVFDVPPNTLVVFRNTEFTCKEVKVLPTYNGLKATMIEWLEYHEVPHTEDMSKAELMSLIETYTNHLDNLYEIDCVLKSHGLKVMRIPDSIANFHPSTLLQDFVETNMNIMTDMNGKVTTLKLLLPTLPEEVLNSAEKYIIEHEESVFKQDITIDRLLDDLVEEMEKEVIKPRDDSDVESQNK